MEIIPQGPRGDDCRTSDAHHTQQEKYYKYYCPLPHLLHSGVDVVVNNNNLFNINNKGEGEGLEEGSDGEHQGQ